MQIEDGKKELIYYKEVDTLKLMQELYEVIPELRPIINNDGIFKVNLRVFTNGNKLILWVLENVNDSLINEIINNHCIIIEDGGINVV